LILVLSSSVREANPVTGFASELATAWQSQAPRGFCCADRRGVGEIFIHQHVSKRKPTVLGNNRGICIVVVPRALRRLSYPSTPEHFRLPLNSVQYILVRPWRKLAVAFALLGKKRATSTTDQEAGENSLFWVCEHHCERLWDIVSQHKKVHANSKLVIFIRT